MLSRGCIPVDGLDIFGKALYHQLGMIMIGMEV